MRRLDLLGVAGRVAKILGVENCLLVGGLAVGAHGYVRATGDVDFVAKSGLTEVRRLMRNEGIQAILTRGDAFEGDVPCVQGTIGGIRVDVMPPVVPIEWARAIEVPVGRAGRLRIVDLEGLLRLKLRAGGPRDLMDVAALIIRHPDQEQRAIEFARAYGVDGRLEVWREDPRLKAEAAVGRGFRGVRRRGKTPAPRKRHA